MDYIILLVMNFMAMMNQSLLIIFMVQILYLMVNLEHIPDMEICLQDMIPLVIFQEFIGIIYIN